jgi:lysophospholipase L1-like esterase
MVANFQTKVVALHPSIVVIMAGASDAAILEYLPKFPTEGALLQNFAKNVTSMVAQAKAANVKVILTTIQTFPPGDDDQPGTVLLFNEWIEQFGQANGIQVVNFHNLLCACLETVAGPEYADVFAPQYSANGPGPFGNPGNNQVPSAAGYQAMDELMSGAVALAQTKFITGYLSNEASGIGVSDQPPNQNNVPIGTALQFVPKAIYSNGQTIPVINTDLEGYVGITNTDLDGHVGTWFTTNPAVMAVSQEGLAFAVGPGKANIIFYNSAGVRFSQWDMTVTSW